VVLFDLGINKKYQTDLERIRRCNERPKVSRAVYLTI